MNKLGRKSRAHRRATAINETSSGAKHYRERERENYGINYRSYVMTNDFRASRQLVHPFIKDEEKEHATGKR